MFQEFTIMVYLLGSINFARSNQCIQQYFDPSAHVMIASNNSITSDSGSLIQFGQKAIIIMEPHSSLNLKQQSGLRVLDKAILHLSNNANMTMLESAHVTCGGRLNISWGVRVHTEASRVLVMGETEMLQNAAIFLYDSSVLRIYEGGAVRFDPFATMAMYRGAAMDVSEWWQHAFLGDVRAEAHFGFGSRSVLFDRSTLDVAKGHLQTGLYAAITLNKQSDLLLKGQLNISDHSSLSIGERARLVIGTESRLDYRPQTAPSLVFGAEKILLELKDNVQVVIRPGTHCLLLRSMKVNAPVTFQPGTAMLPELVCYESKANLVNSMASFKISRTICVPIPV